MMTRPDEKKGKTAKMRRIATGNILNTKQAAIVLHNYSLFRTLREKLERYAGGKPIGILLTEGLIALHPEKNKETIERNVRNWLNAEDVTATIRRETAIELCFVLGLDLEQADDLLASITDCGFHWRDPKDLPFILGLRTGMTYPQCVALAARVDALVRQASAKPDASVMTRMVRDEIENIQTEEELLAYISEDPSRFGRMHNTAFDQFERMLSVLEDPNMSADLKQSEKSSVRDILQEYLFRDRVPQGIPLEGVPEVKKLLLNSVAASWPDESAISRMRNRKADVTRKVLILLFLATDGCFVEDGPMFVVNDDDAFDLVPDMSQPETPVTQEDLASDSLARLDQLLTLCGFRSLDPRNPFDWMILFCMSADDTFEIDDRMNKVLRYLFNSLLKPQAPADPQE